MRDLKFDIPTKLRSSRIEDGKRMDGNGKEYYSRFSVVTTKKGLVSVLEFNWQINGGKIYYTEFSTAIDGFRYSALLDQANLSDVQLKWLSTRFINLLFEKYFSQNKMQL